MSEARHNLECGRLLRMAKQTAEMLIQRVRSETPARNADLLERWIVEFRDALESGDSTKAQDTYRELHAANHARAF